MTISIRNANKNDSKILARLNMAVHQPHFEMMPDRYRSLSPDDPELIATFEERLADSSFYTFIAEKEGQAVGYVQCKLSQKPENIFVHGSLDFHIDQIAVIETHQGQGIGQMLIEHAIQKGQTLQADVISLGVVAFNEGAIRLYERLGFKVSSYKMSMRLGEK